MIAWSSSVGLRLNLRKSKHLFIPKSGSCDPPSIPSIQLVENLRVLGVSFTSDLKWGHHLGNVHRLASSRMHALRILKPILDKAGLITIYKWLILSIIEYCSPVMVGMLSKDDKLLSRINNRVHRLICDQECKCESFPNLQSGRHTASLRLLQKICSSPKHLLHHTKHCVLQDQEVVAILCLLSTPFEEETLSFHTCQYLRTIFLLINFFAHLIVIFHNKRFLLT